MMPKKETTGTLPAGWAETVPKSPIGFTPAKPIRNRRSLITHGREGHIITIAPTGAGKGVSSVIPALLRHPGSTFTIDLKGENYQVTARHRRSRGHRVVALDPFKTLIDKPDTFNPFDILNLPGANTDCDCEMLIELLCGGQVFSREAFWDNTGKGLGTGLVGLAAEDPDLAQRNIGRMLDYLYADDVDYGIAVKLDTHKFKNKLARQELAGYLQHEADRCRPSVRSTLQAMVKSLGSECVRESLSTSSFSLLDWMNGEPMDIYLIFPPDKLDSHRALLRVILGTLTAVLMRRTRLPRHNTLLLLDECAQLGSLNMLRTALTLMRGYGVQVWSFWQDLSQLKQLYERDWETILNNSGTLQVFGCSNGRMAAATADILGMDPEELLSLPRQQQALLMPGGRAVISQRVNYLTDSIFAGHFDPNPRYAPTVGTDPHPSRISRMF